MTTPKLAYVAAAILPFGFVMLACAGIVHVAIGGLKTRRLRRQAVAVAR